MDLSILIPARNEMWLAKTIESVLANIQADTEIIAILDGAWAEPAIPFHPRVKIVYLPEPIGQRAATNLAAKLSDATYVMKLDAHCTVAPGFDKVLIETAKELGPDVTQIPAQYNLHVFDWVCENGHRRYQGPSGPCKDCQAPTTMDVVWQPRKHKLTTAWRFDSDLHFQYWGDYERRPEIKSGELTPTLSCLGACWFLSRERYWELGGMDEAHGSWGQMGTELGCKSWLSGGQMLTNKRTWFAHMFRTQGGDFGFPYEIHGADQELARKYSRNLWKNNLWSKQVRSLKSLIQQFWPVNGWTEEQVENLPELTKGNLSKGIVYYTDARLDPTINKAVRQSLNGHLESGRVDQMVSVTIGTPTDSFGTWVTLDLERGYLTMFKQILTGLEALTTDLVFFCEHDVLYHPTHFEFVPKDLSKPWYNQNVWKVDAQSGKALHYRCSQTSGLCADRKLLIEHYRKRIALVEANGFSRKMGFEPGTHNRPERVDDLKAATWMSALPNVDIRHNKNLTPSRWKKEEFRNQKFTEGWTESDTIPGWGRYSEFI